ncbi:MAG: methyltransferase domain-containing protein, partial [Pseudomonadota bacterium]
LEVDPPVPPRKDSAPWRVRDRDPRRLFSRWFEGVRLDPLARASLTPEEPALGMARRLRAATVVDGFCGAGGDAIALARMPWCREVIAVDLDPARLAMARHNATIYGVEGRIRFLQGDFLELAPGLAGADACFLDPPWDAGPALREHAWRAARAHFPRGALKLPRQDTPPAEASRVEAVMGVGPIISFLLAWWG